MPTSRTDEIAQALWYVAPGHAEIREEKLTAPGPGDVRVRALCGALSRGTERLVLAGHVPASEFERMRAPFMGGNFPFPVKYGYSTVGSVEAGQTWSAVLSLPFTRIKPYSMYPQAPSSACLIVCRPAALCLQFGTARQGQPTASPLLVPARLAR